MNERDNDWWREENDDDAWVQAMLEQEEREQRELAAQQIPYQYEFNFEVAQ